MPISAAIADGGIRIEILQHQGAAEGFLIQSVSLAAEDGGADYKRSKATPIRQRDYAGVIPIEGLGRKVRHLMGSIEFANDEEEPVHFNLHDLTEELQLCAVDSGGPIGISSICGPSGSCRPGSM